MDAGSDENRDTWIKIIKGAVRAAQDADNANQQDEEEEVSVSCGRPRSVPSFSRWKPLLVTTVQN